jgi:predicted lipoprotein with Yx(FWY)xxD motif
MRKSIYLSMLLLLLTGIVVAIPAFAQGDTIPTVAVGGTEELGNFLVNAEGKTLYTFLNDTANTSTCTGECLAAWPALTVASEDDLEISASTGGWLDVITREDTGELQVTFNRHPLYTFADDAAPGDANGQGLGDVWFVARPQLISLGVSSELGSFLTTPDGFTLYTFANDTDDTSTCTGECLAAWPAFTVNNEEELNAGMLGGVAQVELGVITREDTGELQVTLNKKPLYLFAEDTQSGQTNGQGVGDVWFVVKPAVVKADGAEELGAFVVGADGFTLYTFTNDTEGVSNCADECAEVWPPLTVMNAELDLVAGEGVTGTLGTITRDDGSFQVTLDGKPLYYFAGDLQAGEANGQGLGDVWFVASLETSDTQSAPVEATPTEASSSSYN